jgi:hypothetical protein
MSTSTHTYTFGNASNSYFQGNDVVVSRDDGKTVKVNAKDGMWAVNVKAHYWINDLPDDVRTLAEDLNKANARRTHFEYEGQEYFDLLLERQRESWWDYAEDAAIERDFEGVYGCGRSGGWCAINGTQNWDPELLFNPRSAEDKEAGERFLELAFDLHEAIEGEWDYIAEIVKEEHAELEHEREAMIVRGTE